MSSVFPLAAAAAPPSSSLKYLEDGTVPGFPVGFRFLPSAQDIIDQFLINKVLGAPMPDNPIKEMDVYSYNPEDLPITINNSRERWMYFFVYMTEENGKRSTPSGYWKVVESDERIKNLDTKNVIAVKNSFVYHTREVGPNGRYKTNWTMQEFRINDVENLKDPKMKNWVVCKIETPVPRVYAVSQKKKKMKRGRRIRKQEGSKEYINANADGSGDEACSTEEEKLDSPIASP